MDRRTLLRTTSLIPVTLLAACAGFQAKVDTVVAILPKFVEDVSLIIDSLDKYVPEIKTIVGVASSVVGKVHGWVAQAKVIAEELRVAAAIGISATQGLVARFTGVFQQIAASTSSGARGVWQTVLLAGKSLLPGILSAVGIPMADTAPPPYRPEMARAMLAQLVR